MRSSSGIGGRLAVAVVCLALTGAGIGGCTVGDPDDIDFDDDDGAVDAAARDAAAGKDSGTPDDEDGGTDPTPDAGPMGGTLADLPRLFASAACDALEDCIGSKELLADTLNGRDCYELTENLLAATSLRYLSTSVAAGLVQFRPAELESCLDDIRALRCDERSSRLPASCELMLLGTVQSGGTCTIDHDCAGDAYCAYGQMASCPGACAALRAEGMTCHQDNDEQCEDGLVCFEGTCEQLGTNADPCSDALPRCEPGLFCAGGTCKTKALLYSRKLDEMCERGVALCEPGLVCESTAGQMGVCKRTVAKDAACKRSDPNQCPVDQYCDAAAAGESGTCRNYPSEGATCLTMRAQTCADGLTCVGATCRALQPVGEACTAAGQCYSGACGSDGKCAGPLMCDAP